MYGAASEMLPANALQAREDVVALENCCERDASDFLEVENASSVVLVHMRSLLKDHFPLH